MKRFWNKVDIKGPNDCWEWLRAKSRGYGNFWFKDKTYSAHRFVLYLVNGVHPPDDMFVCHHCDNPGCVNPNHLYIGTRSDNGKDMVERGQFVDNLPFAWVKNRRFSDNEVVELRKILVFIKGQRGRGKKNNSLRAVARGYKCSLETILNIRDRKSYAHVL